jgi:hypothetical protein
LIWPSILRANKRNGQIAPPIGPSRSPKQNPPKVSQGRALAADGVGRKYHYVRSNEMSVAELPTADPLTRGRAVASQLPANSTIAATSCCGARPPAGRFRSLIHFPGTFLHDSTRACRTRKDARPWCRAKDAAGLAVADAVCAKYRPDQGSFIRWR